MALMSRKTPLYDEHVDASARIVEFHGWEMPLHYGSQLDEHHSVRENAGVFDVSHMTIVDVTGANAEQYLRRLVANDVGRLKAAGEALYSPMLNEAGGILDDLIVYKRAAGFRVVVNCATRERDLEWMSMNVAANAAAADAAAGDARIDEQSQLAMLAIQGPRALKRAIAELPEAIRGEVAKLEPFQFVEAGEWLVARTGYTGEDGIELMLPAEEAAPLWRALLARGIQAVGLGARDTLRLEAGMNLYGQDMDESTSPLQSALGWTVAWEPSERKFIGRSALEREREQGPAARLTGIVLEERGVVRRDQKVMRDEEVAGTVTSGIFSPTLKRGIGFARVKGPTRGECQLEIRGRKVRARLVKPPFVRNGKKLID